MTKLIDIEILRAELDEMMRTSYELYPITKKHGKTGRDLNYIKRMCYQRKRYAELLRSIIGECKRTAAKDFSY